MTYSTLFIDRDGEETDRQTEMMEKGNMHVIPCFLYCYYCYYYNETAALTYW